MTDQIQTNDFSNAAQKFRDGAMEMKEAVVAQSTDTLQKACTDTESAIKANPYKSVLIAVGVGVALGALVFRR